MNRAVTNGWFIVPGADMSIMLWPADIMAKITGIPARQEEKAQKGRDPTRKEDSNE